MTSETDTLPSWDLHFNEIALRVHHAPGPVLTMPLKLTDFVLINHDVYLDLKPISKVVLLSSLCGFLTEAQDWAPISARPEVGTQGTL